MTTEVVTTATTVPDVVTSGDVDVSFESTGRAVVRARFGETGAAIVVFGASE